VVDSRLIADALGIDHHNFMETIRKYQHDVEVNFGKVPFETEAIGKTRQHQKYALLNEDQAIFLATLSRNSPQVITFKASLVLSFSKMRKELENNDLAILQKTVHELFQLVLANQQTTNMHIGHLQRAVIDACKDIQSLKGQIDFTKQWLEEVNQMVEELTKFYGLPVECFVYVFFNPKNGLYKIGRSHHVGSRKKNFETVQNVLQLVFAIPTRTFKEAVSLEKTLQNRFIEQQSFGEWYLLHQHDLQYLKVMQEANRADIIKG
jgi:phage regulator Rha-like protein